MSGIIGGNAIRREPVDRLHQIITALLSANLFAPRVAALGAAAWVKTLVVGLGLATLVVLSPAILDRVRRRPRALAFLRYGPWCALVGGSVYYEHYTLVPPMVLLLVLATAVLFDSYRRVRWLTGPGLVCLAVLLAISGADLALSWLRQPGIIVEWSGGSRAVRDPLLGFRPVPACTTRAVAHHRGRLIYDVTYTTDERSRRRTVGRIGDGGRMHAIFMGCSYVFGDGVEDWETFPSQFASLTDAYSVYNYGFTGYGPQHMYAQLSALGFAEQIPERSGVLFYCLYKEHLDRCVGTLTTLSWSRYFPRYLVRGDTLHFAGSFGESQPLRVRIAELYAKSPGLMRCAVALDAWLAAHRGVDLVVRLLSEGAMRYRKCLDGTFYVCVWPNRDSRVTEVVARLKEGHIATIDLEQLGVPLIQPQYQIPVDNHPTAEYYRLAAQALTDWFDTGRRVTSVSGSCDGEAGRDD